MRFSFNHLASLAVVVLAVGVIGCGNATGPSGPPIVISVNGATLPSGPIGSTVIIEGQNFGADQGSGTVLFSSSGGTVAATIANADDWTDGFIVTVVPAGTVTGDLVVQTSEGTSTPVTFTVTSAAAFSPSTVSWTATSDLPAALSGLAAAAVDLDSLQVVYALGGADANNAPQTAVYYATVSATGALDAWATTAPLSQAVAFHRAVVATPTNSPVTGSGFIYVLGGATDSAGQPTAVIQRGTLAGDGTVGAWTSGGTLPVALHSFGAAIVFGNLYIWGGVGTDNAPVATAYRAEIQSTGALGAWQTLDALPFGRGYFGFGAFAGHLYALGGDSSATAPNAGALTGAGRIATITYAQIDLRTRDLDDAGWVDNPGGLIKSTSKHTALVAGGSVLVTAGLYNGAATGATEESYGSLNADGTVGSVGGATGSNTIQSGGGGNVFNHAVVGYVDGNGAFHVLVLGGDDVNSPGTKHNKVFFY
jgi:hypothetical protein